MYYIGIDVGKTGGWAFINEDGTFVSGSGFDTFMDFKKDCECRGPYFKNGCFAVVERVHAFPGQGVTSMFSFGTNYGGWLTTMELLEIPHELVLPQRWQKEILKLNLPKGMKSAERRKLTKAKALSFAQRKWPTLNLKKKDEGLVDALCIALYALRLHRGKQEVEEVV